MQSNILYNSVLGCLNECSCAFLRFILLGNCKRFAMLQYFKRDRRAVLFVILGCFCFCNSVISVGNFREESFAVFAGQETPYYYYGDGNRIAYVRVCNESIPADAVALKRLVLRGTNLSYDSVVSLYKFDKYSFTKLRTVYRIQTGNEFDENVFISFELVNEDGYLTNAGALLADESPVRQSRLFCTRWYGLDKASGIMEAIDDKEYSGSLISLLQNGNEFVKNNSKKRWKKTGSGRIEMPDYPDQAVHEALVNALIHRDYTEIGSEVHIDIYDDRLEIYSPGGMIDGSIVQNLNTDNVASKRRNPVIADIFSRMHFMERRGSGFKKSNPIIAKLSIIILKLNLCLHLLLRHFLSRFII